MTFYFVFASEEEARTASRHFIVGLWEACTSPCLCGEHLKRQFVGTINMPKLKSPPCNIIPFEIPTSPSKKAKHELTDPDAVIGGCGGLANKVRNKSWYGQLINRHCMHYYHLTKKQKRQYAQESIIQTLRESGGRFYTLELGNVFVELTDEKLIEAKVMNALRDRALDILRRRDMRQKATKANPSPTTGKAAKLSSAQYTLFRFVDDADQKRIQDSLVAILGRAEYEKISQNKHNRKTKYGKINHCIFQAGQEILTRIAVRRMWKHDATTPPLIIQISAERKYTDTDHIRPPEDRIMCHALQAKNDLTLDWNWKASPMAWISDQSSFAFCVSRNDVEKEISFDEAVTFLKAYRKAAFERVMTYQLYVSGPLADVKAIEEDRRRRGSPDDDEEYAVEDAEEMSSQDSLLY